MAKREKIIIALALAALVYLFKSFLFPTAESEVADITINPAELKRFVTETMQNMKSAQPSALDTYVLDLAGATWEGNPFLESEAPILSETDDKMADAAGKANETVDIVYSGYVESAGKRLAIINGAEYAEGEIIDRIGFVVRKISRDMVVIEEEKSGEKGKKNHIILPMEETYVLQLEKTESQ